MTVESITFETFPAHSNTISLLQKNKYAILSADDFCFSAKLDYARESLWEDWDHLKPDNYLKNGARFRLRRFADFYFMPRSGELKSLPTSTYFQSSELNSYAGGIHRELALLRPSTMTNPFLLELIRQNFRQFPVEMEMANQPWNVDVHQFRILGTSEEEGEPTPEGIHHDENNFVCMHLIGRQNVVGGVNTIYDNRRNPIESCTLQRPMDSITIWEPHVMHGVSAIRPENPAEPGIRDMLVIGYTHEPDFQRQVNCSRDNWAQSSERKIDCRGHDNGHFEQFLCNHRKDK